MYFSKLSILLAFAATILASALPNPYTAPFLIVRDEPIEVNVTFPTTDASSFSTQAFGGGVEGTLQLQWIDRNSIRSRYSVKDTKGDSHSVYMVTRLFNGGNDVLRCQNGLGNGRTQVCDWKRYDRSQRIKSVRPKCQQYVLGSSREWSQWWSYQVTGGGQASTCLAVGNLWFGKSVSCTTADAVRSKEESADQGRHLEVRRELEGPVGF
ncbi:hypothetical protein BU23DRAFT_570272 [Bimuria novae-zelandiae CBS 107.79]|uniref:AA1-like domain-containing protein n=1 Tax=Bimuria novae-zelandiae CBS 107.79 TaxID=1447943 RepID=A0A6A5V1P3_9PLEO|nr:hypothetical protein BU23DRAFT_570272 [Bimuria novae-zelandiae CBS 107.79]